MRDAELEQLRAAVDCRAVFERAGWMLDAAESTARAVKYRAGPARIVIVTHEGRGWFDPVGDARGDVIALAQHVWGGNLGQARAALRPLAGMAPQLVSASRTKAAQAAAAPLDVSAAWAQARRLAADSPGWLYLTGARALPAATLGRAIAADNRAKAWPGQCGRCTEAPTARPAAGRCAGRTTGALPRAATRRSFGSASRAPPGEWQ